MCCIGWKGWSEDLPTDKNCASERARLGIVAGFNPPECKGEPPPGARAFVITLVPAPSKFNHTTRQPALGAAQRHVQQHSSAHHTTQLALIHCTPHAHMHHPLPAHAFMKIHTRQSQTASAINQIQVHAVDPTHTTRTAPISSIVYYAKSGETQEIHRDRKQARALTVLKSALATRGCTRQAHCHTALLT